MPSHHKMDNGKEKVFVRHVVLSTNNDIFLLLANHFDHKADKHIMQDGLSHSLTSIIVICWLYKFRISTFVVNNNGKEIQFIIP